MKKFYVLMGLIAWTGSLLAQYNSGFQVEYFNGHHPSARTEAMAKADVAMNDQVSALWYNPAGIGYLENQEIMLSTSAPFYALLQSDYYFLSYARRIHSKLVAGFSLNQFRVGPSSFDITIDGTRYPLDRPVTSDAIFTLATNPIEHLQVGINAHIFNWKIFDDVASTNSFFLDVGALYALPVFSDKGRLNIGASLVNANRARLAFESPTGIRDSNVLPIILRVGVALKHGTEVSFPLLGTQSLDYSLTTELENYLNADFYTSIRVGGEAILAKYLAVRLGLYRMSLDDRGIEENFSSLIDFTYGFGIIVPISQLTDGAFPFDMAVDYNALENPPRSSLSFFQQVNKRGFSIRLFSPITSN
ncbi:MAG: hypothetical protein AAFY71_26150 [Bacteroidota bacterium]